MDPFCTEGSALVHVIFICYINSKLVKKNALYA